MRTLADAARVDYQHRRFQESLEKSLRAIELSHRADDPRAELAAHYSGFVALTYMGDSEGAERHAAALLALAEKLRDRFWVCNAFLANQVVSGLRGDWRAARDFGDQGLLRAPWDPRLLSHTLLWEYQVGNFGQGEAYLERLLEVMRLTAPSPSLEYAHPAIMIPLVARITGVVDRLDVATSVARTILSSPSAAAIVVSVARAGLGLLAVLRGDPDGAGEQYGALTTIQGILVASGGISGEHLLGLLAQTMGQLDQAIAHFEDALAFCHKAGYRPELAWTCCDYADALLQRNGPGEWARAISLLTESLGISRELGMRPLMERVQALQEKVAAQPTPLPIYPDGLTGREVEVLRLIAAGRSNREIAEELTISLKTVARHISNIFAKTSAANRTEAAAYATRHKLVSW
jgi:ATP/maltotriose-dependent transcriptional regulator MalT